MAVSKRYRYGFGAFACRVGGTKKAFGAFDACNVAVSKRYRYALGALHAGLAFDAWPKSATWQFRNLGAFACQVGGTKKAFGAFDAWPKNAWPRKCCIPAVILDMALVPLRAVPKKAFGAFAACHVAVSKRHRYGHAGLGDTKERLGAFDAWPKSAPAV